MENETWKDVVGYEGLYRVSSKGRMWGCKRKKILSPCENPCGYPVIVLCKDGVRKGFAVHRLVAKAFIPNPEGKPQVNHKDFNTSNNSVQNLEWVTAKENVVHANQSGRVKRRKGENHHRSKYTNEQIEGVYRKIMLEECKQKEAGQSLGILQSTISLIKTKRLWKDLTDRLDKDWGLL